MHYVPIGLPFFLAFWFLFAILAALIQIGVLQFAFQSMGVSRRYMFSLLVLSLLGSYINIPVGHLAPERVLSGRIVDYFGIPLIVPYAANSPGTVVAVNVGGAVIPFLLSLYLIVKHSLYVKGALAVGIVTVVIHLMCRRKRSSRSVMARLSKFWQARRARALAAT